MTSAAAKQEFTKGEFLPLPEGDYLVRMTNYDEVETSKKNGKMVKATFQVVNGDYKNRLIFENFLVEHENPKAEQIGQERLSKYLQSVGVSGGLEALGNDRTLLGDYLEMPFIASLKIEEGREYVNREGKTVIGKDRNVITAFKTR